MFISLVLPWRFFLFRFASVWWLLFPIHGLKLVHNEHIGGRHCKVELAIWVEMLVSVQKNMVVDKDSRKKFALGTEWEADFLLEHCCIILHVSFADMSFKQIFRKILQLIRIKNQSFVFLLERTSTLYLLVISFGCSHVYWFSLHLKCGSFKRFLHSHSIL